MNNALNQNETLNQLKRSLEAIKELRTRLEAVEQVRREPIAIIGMGCRFPGGANTPQAFWHLLKNGVDAISEIPANRWNANALYDPDVMTPGKMNTRWGGFLDQVDLFDPAFFGISPREAAHMDPQQRLLLEVAYEALEEAGLSLERLAGSQTGAFVGIHSQSNDYTWFQLNDLSNIDAYTATGTAHSIAANRLSYVFDLRGPSLIVDTACSSSLIAVHLACQSLRNEECSLALAGGVNLMLSPEATVAFSKLQMMATDGRCKTFDARADGFVRGEGCGLVVLKRLSDALANGDPILALIQGSAMNQDGHTNGLTAPNGLSQEAVIRQALTNARVDAAHITYVETHGTGTALGDPIEVEALANVIGHPTGQTCFLGSVKTNIGHLEAAAGIAGLIKAVLALQHGTIPPNLHFQRMNPYLSLAKTRFAIPTEAQPWPLSHQPRYAAISSYGFGGTNGHLILKEAPPQAEAQPEAKLSSVDQPYLLPLSARSPEALQALARTYHTFLAKTELSLADVCYSASLHRSHLEHRLALVGTTPAELLDRLELFGQGEAHPDLAAGEVLPSSQPGLVFVFSGQGPQWPGMGQELLRTEPVFRAMIEECDQLLRQQGATWSLFEELTADPAQSRLAETEIAQPGLLALQIALTALWRSWGIEPEAVVGHSLGEIAAACVAGVITLPEAIRIAFQRGRLMQQAAGLGKMAALGLSQAEAEKLLAHYSGRLSVAAVNSPISIVLSGEQTTLEEVLQAVAERGVFNRVLPGDYAFHSPQMDPFQQELVEALTGLKPRPAAIPVYSTVTGGRVHPEDFDAVYWGRNLREPVRFAAAIAALEVDGYRAYVEISPHPVLTLSISQSLASSQPGMILSSLHRDQNERAMLLRTLGALYTQGYPVNWKNLYQAKGRFVGLPTYPWQRKRYWLKTGPGPYHRPTTQTRSQDELLNKTQGTPADISNWFYEVAWQQSPKPGSSGLLQSRGVEHPQMRNGSDQARSDVAPAQPGRWLIFADQTGAGALVADQLRQQGEVCTLVFPGSTFKMSAEGNYRLNPTRLEDFQHLFEKALPADGRPFRGVIHLWSLDLPRLSESTPVLEIVQPLGCESVLYLVQALARLIQEQGRSETLPRLWLATKGVQPVEPLQEKTIAISQAPVWGLGRVIALEHPELWGGLIDLDPEALAEAGLMVLAEIGAADGEDQVAYRQGQRYIARLRRSAPDLARSGSSRLDPAGAYLITGGLGSLGLHVAYWLAAQGARHLVLTSRTGLPVRADWERVADDSQIGRRIRAVRALEALGLMVTVAQADVSDRAQMATLFKECGTGYPPLRGIIHAAGIVTTQPLLELEAGTLQETLRAKVTGAWLLHHLSRQMPLDLFVLFSSGAAIWGSAGMAPYAAANHFLDSLAHYRRSLKLPALSINWGWWSGGGMATAEVEHYFTQIGLEAMAPEQALGALDQLLATGVSQKTVAAVNWQLFKPIYEARRRRPLLEQFETQTIPLAVNGSQAFVRRLEVAAPAERWELLLTHIRNEVAKVLGFDPAEPPVLHQGFFKLGMNSIMTVQLCNRLETSLGCSLPPTIAFEYPTIEALTRYLAAHVLSIEVADQPAPPEKVQTKAELTTPLEDMSEEDLLSLFDNELATINELVEGDQR